MKKKFGFCLIFSFSVYCIVAQNDSVRNILPDRPTQTESAFLLPKGSFQIETGIVYIDRDDQEKQIERFRLATTLFRYGVFSNFEIRFSDSYEWMHVFTKADSKDSTESGMGPVTAGFKVFVAEEKGIRPEMSIIGNVTFRHLGNEVFGPTYSYPLGKIVCIHTLSKKFSLAYNLGFSYSGETADGFLLYSVYIGYYITPSIWTFAEAYGNFDHGDLPNHRGDAGFTFRVRKNLQFDVTGGMSFVSGIQRYVTSAGLSWRIPK